MKRCSVVFATLARQWIWTVEMPDGGTVAEALQLARAQAGKLPIPWDADVGIFGELCDRATVPREGDRIELYRALRLDPKESRRARARAGKTARDPALSRPPKPE
jgi:putative ubiquitin-RnfH superfamily antitoxin RatB of RatAB toxin-antitoxin module